MLSNTFAILSFILAVCAEVPQEHSHDLILSRARIVIDAHDKGNSGSPFSKVDPVFGLLADKGAKGGIDRAGVTGSLADVPCLHQNIADNCLSNAKKQNLGKDSKAACIQYAALERNTPGFGTASALCNQTPQNAELKNVKAHQDPASKGASETNRAVEIEVAKQMMALGFNVNDSADLALRTATFAGKLLPGGSDFEGNSCDAPPGFTKFGGDVPNVFADKDGVVFGETIKRGQQIDCGTLGSLDGDILHTIVPQVSKQELLSILGGSNVVVTPRSDASATTTVSQGQAVFTQAPQTITTPATTTAYQTMPVYVTQSFPTKCISR